jgi:hypothetical protein
VSSPPEVCSKQETKASVGYSLMVLVWFLRLQLELLPSIHFSPDGVDVSYASKSFVKAFRGSTNLNFFEGLISWTRFNLRLTSMVSLAALNAGVAKPGQRRSPEAAVP